MNQGKLNDIQILLNLRQLHSYLTEKLRGLPISINAEEEAGIILQVVTGKSPLQLVLEENSRIIEEQRLRLASLIKKLESGIPIAYALGEWYFAGRSFFVNQHVVIPRPDTETLLGVARKFLETQRQHLSRKMRVLEIGVGCGAVIISLALDFPKILAYGTDCSKNAIAVARRNALRHNAKVRFLRGDLFSPLEKSIAFNLIVSNPPYVSDPNSVERYVRDFEPREGIFVPEGEDAFYFHRRITQEAPNWLFPEGMLALEVGIGQAKTVAQLMEDRGFENILISKDISGIDRVVSGIWHAS